MRIPPWLAARTELHAAMPALPRVFPPPELLLSPRTDEDIEAWHRLEASRRAVLDDTVRAWLRHRRWPAFVDAANGHLLALRFRAALDWLDLGAVGAVEAEDPTALLAHLLIDGWSECFLHHHLRELDYRRAEYSCGRADAIRPEE